jgi:Tol biopolymer transport system component
VRRLPLAVALLAFVLPAARAHHRQTPAVTAITTAGDATLPRLPPPSRKAIAATVDGTVTVYHPFADATSPAWTFAAGTNANPSISSNGRTIAWDTDADPLASGEPGRQVVVDRQRTLLQPRVDPTGTSANPALDLVGTWVAFESTADFAGTGNAGARQVFLVDQRGGTVVQLSRGVGTSRNPAVGRRGRRVVFESTSHAATGVDTGVAQIWTADPLTGAAGPITAGLGDSTKPSLSNDGRIVVFESRADLAGDGADTGVPQVFAYDTTSRTFARITDDAGGCTGAGASRIKRDWRIAYVCEGTAYFTMLRANERYRIQVDGGETTRLVPQADAHFLLIATTANLLAGGTTDGRRVYMVNLFARPAAPVPGDVVWF